MPDAPQPLRCAVLVIDDRGARVSLPLAELLQAELATRGGLALLERAAVAQVLKEQQLGEAFGAGQTARRAALGRVLRADLLIVLRPGTARPSQNAPPLAEAAPVPVPAAGASGVRIVVCETRRGLRLVHAPLPAPADPEAAARAAAAVVDVAVAKLRGPAPVVVAVPPFTSGDLSHEFDHLKAAYGKLVEQALLRRDGLLVVELDEARSLADEVALAEGPDVRREAPIYVLGEYQTTRAGPAAEPAVSVGVSLHRGDAKLAGVRKPGMAAPDVPGFLAATLAGWAETLGAPAAGDAVADAGAEARRLAGRARASYRLGDWAEAIPLYEASLLLDPKQPDLRLELALAMSRTGPTFDEQHALGRALRTRGAAREDRDRDAAAIEAYIAVYLRRLEHLEAFLRDGRHVSEPTRHNVLGSTVVHCMVGRPEIGRHLGRHEALVVYNERVGHAERAMFLRLIRERLAADAPRNEVIKVCLEHLPWRVGRESLEDGLRLALAVFREVGHLPEAPAYASVLVATSRHGFGAFDQRHNSPERHKFLAVRRTLLLDALRAWPDERVARTVDKDEASFAQITKRPKPPAPTTAPSGDGAGRHAVSFRPIEFTAVGSDGRPIEWVRYGFQGWKPIGDNLDVVWDPQVVWLMREPGKLEAAFDRSIVYSGVGGVSYDGRYLWAAFLGAGREPELHVREPQAGGRTWRVTAAHGLPIGQDVSGATPQSYALNVVGLEPGKACVAGSFGRNWLATVTLDPEAGPSAKVFHEARERPADVNGLGSDDAWLDTNRVYHINGLHLLQGPAGAGGGPRPRRVLITGRGDRPLVVDPDAGSVAAMKTRQYPGNRDEVYAQHDGSVYVVTLPFSGKYAPAMRGPHLYRIGFPTLEPELVMANVPQNYVRFAGGRAVVVGKQLWELEPDPKQVWPKAVRVPWHHANHWPMPGQAVPDVAPQLEQGGAAMVLTNAFVSSHYGLVIHAWTADEPDKSLAVTFEEPAPEPGR